MKALILAAGLGTRLAPLTDDKPKSLVEVNGTPILFKQISNLVENNIKDITVVSGYKADVLEKRVREAFPFVKIVESKDYMTTNNMYSAYLGIKSMGEIDEMLMMNADVFMDASVVKALIECEHKNAIVVDVGHYNEESMKVVQDCFGNLIEISKTIKKEDALGNSIDLYKFNNNGVKHFFEACKEYIEIRKELKKWSEVALNDALKVIPFKPCNLVGRWFEIDNHEDLASASKLFKNN